MLYYHKCNDCLTPFSSTEKKIDLCDCMGKVSFMGIVHGEKWEKVENRAPCDGRCTHAHGPVCDCQCGGVNHGTGRTVQTVVAEGKIKVVSTDHDILEDMKRGYRFRDIKIKADALFTKRFGTRNKWEREVREAQRALNHAVGLKVYNQREKAIINWVLEYSKEESSG